MCPEGVYLTMSVEKQEESRVRGLFLLRVAQGSEGVCAFLTKVDVRKRRLGVMSKTSLSFKHLGRLRQDDPKYKPRVVK